MCKINDFALIIEKNLINLCIKAANISCGEVVKEDYKPRTWAKVYIRALDLRNIVR
ncbi:hypothetical protein KTC96_07055 [Clostridium estertheticum]|uniref:hypothetical protein n=1 Tax=Clostridium estertheticum TaxID=238834 RepID=UPI001C7D4370|nr:hypothetical protein [Clostridium estertheticum]MBX4261204.1 hypothetical protein [Clostridium estertheticum]WLC71755.1 hypothetical protein KTC96_07055 [Clostridium estertheticum]